MDFSFTPEQQMLLDSARRYVREHYGFEDRRRAMAGERGYSDAAWRALAELGLLAINASEADGGLGAGPVENLLVSLVVGEGLLVEPVLSSAILATRTLALLGDAGQRARWLGPLMGGEAVGVLAASLGTAARAPAPVLACETEGGWRLDGEIRGIYHADHADVLFVAAATVPGGADDAVFIVPADTAGVVRRGYATVDGQRAADVAFDRVRLGAAERLGGAAEAALRELSDVAVVALCAEAVGAMDRALELTLDYTRTRQQFGGPIARFQVLQHRMVDMRAAIEQARSLVYLATARLSGTDAEARRTAASAAKVLVADAARNVGQQAVQLHGGMGVCEEMAISHYFRRLLAATVRFGSADEHLGVYAAGLANA